MNAKFLRSCGLAALLAVSAVAEPVPAAQPAKVVAPTVQAVKKPAPDRITSNDEPAKKVPAAPLARPAAPPLVNQKPPSGMAAPAAPPVPPAEHKLVEKPAPARPVTAAPAAGKTSEAPAKPVTAAPATSKISEAPAKPVTAAPAASKITEAPAKPVTASPAASKITEVPTAKPVTAAPAAGKITEAPAAKPVTAAPAPGKITEAPAAKPVTAAPAASKITEVQTAKPVTAAPAASKITEAPAAKPVTAAPAASKVTEAPIAKPVTAAPAGSKITEVPTAKPVTAAPAAGKITDAPPAKPVTAAPAASKVTEAPAAKPVTAAPAAQGARPAATATTKPIATPPMLTESNLVFPQAKTELKRLMIGNQAGIVKVLGPNREGVSYTRGIDDKNIARFSDDACGSIFCALGISHDKLNKVAQEIMINYSTLPRKEAVAFLGAVAASPHLTPEVDAKAEQFLVQVMETDKDVHARRQAVLALAVKHNVASTTTDHVLALFEHSENLWETFPVQQYFEYHAGQVKRLANFHQLRERIAAVKSLYTPAILEALDGSKPVTVVP